MCSDKYGGLLLSRADNRCAAVTAHYARPVRGAMSDERADFKIQRYVVSSPFSAGFQILAPTDFRSLDIYCQQNE
jgi:hypothetical protein